MTQDTAGSLAPRPPRTLLVVDSLARNGAVRISVELARRWAAWGARLAVVQRPPGMAAVTPPPGVDVVHLSGEGARLRQLFPDAMRTLVMHARRAEVVVGCSEIGVGLLLGFVAARLARRPFVVSVHADLDAAIDEWVAPRLRRLYYWVHRHVDAVVCVDEGLVAPLLRNGLPPGRIRVVRNGIDGEAVRRAAAGPGNLVTEGAPVVVATGRLAPQKAYDLLLRAHAEVVHRVPHQVLVLNDGPDEPALRALAEQLGVASSVIFAGSVESPLPSVANASLFCLPSRTEGLPLALLEAVVLGVPVIAADCSAGVRAALDDGRLGELVPVGDVHALARALERHLTDPEPLRRKASEGPAYARGFDFEVMAQGWAEALRDLCGRSPAVTRGASVPPA